MSMSVPGNSCRPCRGSSSSTSQTSGCLVRVPGECVYYTGTSINPPGINVGDTFNTVVVKLVGYINSSVQFPPSIIPITSEDFEPDGVTVNRSSLLGVNFEIYLNDLNRFIYNEVGNQEWDYISGGGFEILIPDFDSNSINYHLYLLPKA